MAVTVFQNAEAFTSVRRRSGLRRAMQRKSAIAFLMTLPLIVLVAIFVVYPALYSLHLATLNKSMERFVGFGNFQFLFRRETFWMVVKQSCIFAITAVVFKAIVGFVIAHFVHNIPSKGQRKWSCQPRLRGQSSQPIVGLSSSWLAGYGCVGTRPIEAADKARCDRIGTTGEDDRNCRGCRVGGQ